MIITGVSGEVMKDSRGQDTILVTLATTVGIVSASAPNGKSTGKHEVPSYKKSLDKDIEALERFSDYFSDEIIGKFEDLRRIEDIVDGHIGGNTLFALESAVLKALSLEQKRPIWQLINPKASSFPRLMGNCIGGGKHSEAYTKKHPDFQEFLLVPTTDSPREAYAENKATKKRVRKTLEQQDKKFSSKMNDEKAWVTSLSEKEALDLLSEEGVPLALDVAASSFYKRKHYHYTNPPMKRTVEEQLMFLSLLLDHHPIVSVEDPFFEEDFESYAALLKKFPDRMIVGDDLTVTSSQRLKKAIDKKAVNALIVKPNQCGSLLEVQRVVDLAKKHKIKTIFSHRSGETEETILADLAVGFGADFFKCGIEGDVREKKIKRLVQIEKEVSARK